MKDKFDSIHTKLAKMQSEAQLLVSDCAGLLAEMDAKQPEVAELDKRVTLLHETEHKISEAQKKLTEVQNAHVSVTQRLQEMKESIKV